MPVYFWQIFISHKSLMALRDLLEDIVFQLALIVSVSSFQNEKKKGKRNFRHALLSPGSGLFFFFFWRY